MKDNYTSPPKFGQWILKKLLSSQEREYFLTDMEIGYSERLKKMGQLYTIFWYWKQLLRTVPPLITDSIKWSAVMFKNYLKIAFRNIKKYKVYSFINIFGFSVGIACTLLILLWVMDETSYDSVHKNADRIYRIVSEYHTNEIYVTPNTPAGLIHELNSFREIEKAARISYAMLDIQYGNSEENTYEGRGIYADSGFLDMFDYPLISGSRDIALSDKNSIVISRRMAETCFGDTEPIGKSLKVDNSRELVVTGVLDNSNINSHLEFEYIIPMDYVELNAADPGYWGSFRYKTYILLNESSDTANLSKNIEGILTEHVQSVKIVPLLQPLRQIRLYGLNGGGLYIYIYALSAVSILILCIACINYMNLSTAKSIKRSKEVGLRKTFGAQRSSIILQFFSESFVFTSFAVIIAILGIMTFLPVFNNLTGKQLTFAIFTSIPFLKLLTVITLVTGFISGTLPAVYLSRFNPIDIFKRITRNGSIGINSLRKVMVVFQFSLTIFFVICTFAVMNQLDFIKNKNLGFEKADLIYMDSASLNTIQFESLKNDLIQSPGIVNITRTNVPLLELGWETRDVDWVGKTEDQQISFQIRMADHDYLETFGMKMADGRFFSNEFISDRQSGFIVNEAAVKLMGLESPVGSKFRLSSMEGTIIGVIKDFHHHSLKDKIEPLCLLIDPSSSNCIFVRISPDNANEAISTLQNNWERINPGTSFSFSYFDESVNSLYADEYRIGKLLNYFTVFTIIIACLGLFGLSSFIAEQRTKEIGIRKVLGASIPGIINALSKEYLVNLLIASVIAWPAAKFVIDKWLATFAYGVSPGFVSFVYATILVFFIASVTYSFQSVKAAIANPVETLRYE